MIWKDFRVSTCLCLVFVFRVLWPFCKVGHSGLKDFCFFSPPTKWGDVSPLTCASIFQVRIFSHLVFQNFEIFLIERYRKIDQQNVFTRSLEGRLVHPITSLIIRLSIPYVAFQKLLGHMFVHPKRKVVYQPPIFRGYVSFMDCISCVNYKLYYRENEC